MEIIWHGHSAFSIEFNNKKILIDPFLTGNPSFNDKNFKSVISGVTHITLTHGHSDHLGDTVKIAKELNAMVIANADLCSYLGHLGVKNLNPGNTGGTIKIDDFSLTFVQAHHSSSILDQNGFSNSLGNSNGLVFHFNDGMTIYHMGDTDIFSDMRLINELHKPDVGIIPIGDRFTMGGAVAALCCRRYFNFKYIIPCHFGTFDLIDKDTSKFIESMEEDKSKIKELDVGGKLVL